MAQPMTWNTPSGTPQSGPSAESYSSGVSWAAVFAGGVVAAAFSLLMLALGAGLGFSVISMWANQGISATAASRGAVAWFILTEVVASALGGYLAGRLRTKWAAIHGDEVYFRDTANGLLVWALGLVVAATFFAAASATLAGSVAAGTSANPNVTAPAASAFGAGAMLSAGTDLASPNSYFTDTLLRLPAPQNGAPAASAAPAGGGAPAGNGIPARGATQDYAFARAEAGRLLAYGLMHGAMTPEDDAYLAQIVSAQTGLSLADAEGRVSHTFNAALASAEAARKATARLLLWLCLGLIAGAFCASLAATLGGRQRDHVRAI